MNIPDWVENNIKEIERIALTVLRGGEKEMTEKTNVVLREEMAAIKESAHHWHNIALGREKENGGENCALCEMFGTVAVGREEACSACPIKKKTGREGCGGSPWSEWQNHQKNVHGSWYSPRKVQCPECKRIALKFEKWILDLLPQEKEFDFEEWWRNWPKGLLSGEDMIGRLGPLFEKMEEWGFSYFEIDWHRQSIVVSKKRYITYGGFANHFKFKDISALPRALKEAFEWMYDNRAKPYNCHDCGKGIEGFERFRIFTTDNSYCLDCYTRRQRSEFAKKQKPHTCHDCGKGLVWREVNLRANRNYSYDKLCEGCAIRRQKKQIVCKDCGKDLTNEYERACKVKHYDGTASEFVCKKCFYKSAPKLKCTKDGPCDKFKRWIEGISVSSKWTHCQFCGEKR